MPLTIVANIHAVPGKEDLVHAELQKLVAPTRKEEGCLQYDLAPQQRRPCALSFLRELGDA